MILVSVGSLKYTSLGLTAFNRAVPIIDVSYTLSIIIISVKSRVDDNISSCYISVDKKITPRNDGLCNHA